MTTMFPTKLSAHETCDVLINAIKSSNLHFVFQETPHSAYITIRKKFVNKAFSKASGNDIDTRAALKNLEIEYNKLKKDFEEKTASHEESLYLVKTLENKLDKVEENFIIDSEKLKTNNEEFTKKKNTAKKKQKKVNEPKKIAETKEVEIDENIEVQDSDMNQNLKISVPVHNKFEILDKTRSLSVNPLSSLVSKRLSTTAQSTLTSSDVPVGPNVPDSFSNKASFSPTEPSVSHTPPGTPPRAPPGTQLLPGSPASSDQRSNSTIDEIKEAFRELSVKQAFSELSVEINSMSDRLANRLDQACKVPATLKF